MIFLPYRTPSARPKPPRDSPPASWPIRSRGRAFRLWRTTPSSTARRPRWTKSNWPYRSCNNMPAKTKFEVKLGAATREAFGRALVELGRENKDIVVCDADLAKSTMTTYFQKEFPDRFFSCGIAEANMTAIGAGLAYAGKVPFVASFSAFVMNKGFEQLRTCAAYPKVNLKVVGTHSGISIGEDGPSQMSVEEISLACSLPGFTVLSPADEASM